MTRNEMVSLYRTLTNHETNFIDNDAVTDLLNRGAQDFQREVEILEAADTQDVTSGTSVHTLPADFIRVIRIEHDDLEIRATTQESLTINNRNWRDDTGTPRNFYMENGNIQVVLFPEPDTTLAAGLRIEYVQTANTMTASTDSNLPRQYHELVVFYAAGYGHMRDGETTQAKFYISEYKREVEKARVKLSRRTPALRIRKRGQTLSRSRRSLNLGSNYPIY